MPIIKSAIKKLRQDKKRTILNKNRVAQMKRQLKKFLKEKTDAAFRKTVSLIDRLAKKRIIHKNKAARLKSRLSHHLASVKS